MKASNILTTLFTCSVQEYILKANTCYKTVQRLNLVEKILDQIMRESEGGSKASKWVAIFW